MINQSISSLSKLERAEQYISIYGPFTLTTLGIIGNILSILIFLSPRYRRQSSHFYLLSLALSDLCFLIINLIEDTFRNHNALYRSRINILDRSSPLVCILGEYARNTTRLLSSWIIVSFTIERLLVVFYPLKRAFICRRKIARYVVLILFLLSLLININVPFHYGITNKIDNHETICDILPAYRKIYMRFAISSMITVYLVPMCLIGIVNTLICCKLWSKSLLTEKTDFNQYSCENYQTRTNQSSTFSKLCSCLHVSSNNQQRTPTKFSQPSISTEMNSSKATEPFLSSPSRQYLCSAVSNPSTMSERNSSQNVKTYIQSRTNRVTVTLLLVSCSFLLLNSPYCAIWIVNYIQGFSNSILKSIKEITELFMLTNFCINFLLYCLSGKIFRSELMYLLRCQWKQLYNKHENERLSKRFSRPKANIQMRESQNKLHPNQCLANHRRYHRAEES